MIAGVSLLAAAPLMRYGKYCGVSYTGCPGEAPCDALDACCAAHDACVQATDSRHLSTLHRLILFTADQRIIRFCSM